MKYKSTRGGISGVSFEDAVMTGLAPDGGLFIPERIPQLTGRDLKHLSELTYKKLAFEVMRRFTEGFPENDLEEIINKSFVAFDAQDIVPIIKAGGLRIAELFHGPTFAFKDIALQFLGNLFEYILKSRGETMNILGATSGDTGSAAIYGVRGKKDINIFILYPYNRVSPVQEMQMTAAAESNVHCLAVTGNFDNCQEIVKSLFGDEDFKKSHNLGAVNSINWARILAQIVYYFHIYFKMSERVGDPVNIVVPTGNFGNVFAGFIAKTMGLPIGKLVLATNRNNILTRAVKFGDYSVERVRSTHSPSMDIQLASNFERYLYYLYEEDTEKVAEAMQTLKREQELEFRGQFLGQLQRDFIASDAEDSEIEEAIKKVYNQSEYLIDPHTACGVHAAYELEIEGYDTAVLATAHPAKFPEVIKQVLGFCPETPLAIQALENAPKKSAKVYPDPEEVKKYILNHI